VGFFHEGIFRVTVMIRSTCDLGYVSWSQNDSVSELLVGENHMILGSFVLTHYQRVTDGHAAYSCMTSRFGFSIAESDEHVSDREPTRTLRADRQLSLENLIKARIYLIKQRTKISRLS